MKPTKKTNSLNLVETFEFRNERLPISAITTDPKTQLRGGLDLTAIEDYAADMKAGDEFPPLLCVHDGSKYYLFDGYHRLQAAIDSGIKELHVRVTAGSLEDASLAAAFVNQKHGVRRSNANKRNAVALVLSRKEAEGVSSREIARILRVSHTFVSRIRNDLERLKAERDNPESKPRLVNDLPQPVLQALDLPEPAVTEIPATLPPEDPPPEPRSIVVNTPREHGDPEAGRRPLSPKHIPDKKPAKPPREEEELTAATNSLPKIRKELAAVIRGVLEPESDNLRQQSGNILVEFGERLLDGEDI